MDARITLVARREGAASRHYAYLGTGNFNEKTARIYADHGLLTADPRLTDEVRQAADGHRLNHMLRCVASHAE